MSGGSAKKRKLNDDPVEDEEMQWSDDEGTRIDGIYIPPPSKPMSASTSATRLIITKITNNFFKSYARDTVLGPFSKCFNAIVGPNGSGKSNVIDSMLFVFGYRATKIRSKKISVLLHNSEKFRNVQSCEVSVHFCEIIDKEGKNFEVVSGSEFVVSRVANKDNSSYYLLNGAKVHFKEVAQLLRNHGIDLDHNRFLILQGEVEEIAMMKCKGANDNETGMLEYLEDIIGTTRYKKPLIDIAERIENLSVLRSEKLNRVKLIEKELDELKKPMEEAVGFLKMENKAAQCRNFLYQKNIFGLEEKITEIGEEKGQISDKHQALKDRLKEFESAKVEKERTLEQDAIKYESLQTRRDKMKEAFAQANRKDMQLQADMVQTNNNRKKMKEQLLDEKKKVEKLERIPQESEKSIVECETREEELTTKKEELEEQKAQLLSTLRTETKELQKEKEGLEIELGKLKKIVGDTKSAYDVADSELQLALSNEETEKSKLEKIRETVKTNEETLTQRTHEISQLRKKIPLTQKSLDEATSDLNKVKGEEAQLINAIKTKRMHLEETRSSMQSSRSRGKILDALMQQKREGNCDGLYGRLGDLGAIDQKYDIAISTACGPLDNIVVDTVATAQWCIEFLKQHGIGRATFIALDKQEHLREASDAKIRTPENVHRLFDLIHIQDEAIRPAFYFSLRDTLVADDLEQASRIAYGAQRYRVVTLKGDLIETSGTMSGGGRTASRGRMGQSVITTNVQPKDIESLESDLSQHENRLRALHQQQNALESQINTLQPELAQMKINLEKYMRELEVVREQQPLLLQQLKKQENVVKSTKSDAEQVQKLTNVVEKRKGDYESAAENAKELQVEVDKITKEIKAKTSGKIKALDKSLADATGLIDNMKKEIVRLRVAITTSARNAKKAHEKIASLESNIEESENRLRQMKSDREEIVEDVEKLNQCIDEIAGQMTGGETEYAELKKQVAALVKEENKMKLEMVDSKQALTTITDKFNECKGAMIQWQTKLKQLSLHTIPNETTDELKTFQPEDIQSRNAEEVELELHDVQNGIKTAKPNLNVIQEYRTGETTYLQRTKELDEVTKKRNEMKNVFDQVKTQRKVEFMIGYNIIKLKLKEMYQMITLGGDADFEIVDSFDPFSDGIQFNVRPPKKSWKNISNLSGGEKTLSSLALVFALHYYKPSPLYVMDEIDAALDFKNVSIVGHYIKERTKNAQFIIISLRSNMFELCDNLVGIYKIFNCTQTITIDPNGFKDEPDIEDNNDKENSNVAMNAVENSQSTEILTNGLANDIDEIDDSFGN